MFSSLSFHATTNEMKEIATNNWNLETRSLTCPTIYSIVLNKKKTNLVEFTKSTRTSVEIYEYHYSYLPQGVSFLYFPKEK